MPKEDSSKPIGIFDSGIGGLTVVRELLELLPHENFIYLGDMARLPYGNKSPSTIIKYSKSAADFLVEKEVKMILIACNTASAAAYETLKQTLPIPVLSVIPAAVDEATRLTITKEVAVIGTLATIRSAAYEKQFQKTNPSIQVKSLACPLFVPLAEEGWFLKEDWVVKEVCYRYLSELHKNAERLDTLILGCTHYPLLKEVIQEVVQELWSHPVFLVDSSREIAKQAAAYVKEQKLENLRVKEKSYKIDRLLCYVTDESRVLEVGGRFLGQHLENIELIELKTNSQ